MPAHAPAKSKNALTDVAWIDTTDGLLTPRQVLLAAHKPRFFLSFNRPAFEIASQFRFLLSVLAVVIQGDSGNSAPERLVEQILDKGLSESLVDHAINRLAQGADLFDRRQPFMQRPPLPTNDSENKKLKLGPKKNRISELSPSLIREKAEDFWNLILAQPDQLSLHEATLALTTYHYYSMTNNGGYNGNKPQNGAPGIRLCGIGNTATEYVWRFTDGSLLHSLCAALPKYWVATSGLPAWALRNAADARLPDGDFHPLWKATWSSNTAACCWNDDMLVGVRVGGVPGEWLPISAEAEPGLKEWWDTRNEKDPMYLYLPDNKGQLKAQRIDFGRDATQLAVEWTAEHKIDELSKHTHENLLEVGGVEATPVFFRHQIEGTSSSPSIRASEVFIADRNLWGFGLSDRVSNKVAVNAGFVRKICNIITKPFPKKKDKVKKPTKEPADPMKLSKLIDLGKDVSTEYWRQVTSVYERYLAAVRENKADADELYHGVQRAALDAFDFVTAPHIATYANNIYFVRAVLQRCIKEEIKKADASGVAEMPSRPGK